ncbi:hypothetical protein MSAN_02416300 [Mycena sanguinolenta]|uniref:Uncharacterized protein n=1 Tax=Mycena sanguinolenta TaxID=230812 RepID=A0A8H6X360_9AGAR|nr:hypothetical protein MSAN_02416300 [Mycena sanguinolenta]
MKLLALLPFIFTLSAGLPTPRQTEATCTTRYSAINSLIEDLEARVIVAEPTFFTSTYGSKTSLNCCGTDVQTYVDNILAVIATPDSWCNIDGDGWGGYDCSIEYL